MSNPDDTASGEEGGPADPDTCIGTIVAVLDTGGGNREWRALVREATSSKPVHVRSRHVPAHPNVGDEVVLSGTRSSGRPPLTSCDFTVDVVHEGGATVGGYAGRPGVRSRTVDCGRDGIEPDVAWGLERFGTVDIPTGRGAVIVLQPSVLLGVDKASLKATVIDMLPRTGFPRGVENVAEWVVKGTPCYHRMGKKDSTYAEKEQAGCLVVPYDLSEDGLSYWRHMSWLWYGFMPRVLPSPRARNMMTIAHEMAHAYGIDFNALTKNLLQVAEGFADAVCLMTYVLDTGDHASAHAMAGMRCVSILEGDPYMTGAICIDAIAEIGRLESAYPGQTVPMEAIMVAAERITRSNAIMNVETVKEVRALLKKKDPRWKVRSPERMRASILKAASLLPVGAPDRDKVIRLMELAASAIATCCYTPHELLDLSTFRRAMDVVARDLADTGDYLRETGMASGVEIMVASARDKAEARTWRLADGSADRIMTVFDKVGAIARGRNTATTASGRRGTLHNVVRAVMRAEDRLDVAIRCMVSKKLIGYAIERRAMVTYCGILSDLPRLGGTTIRRAALVSLDKASTSPVLPGRSVCELLADVQRLALQECDLVHAVRTNPGNPSDDSLLRINHVRRRGRDIALGLCLDPAAQDAISETGRDAGLDLHALIEKMACWRTAIGVEFQAAVDVPAT